MALITLRKDKAVIEDLELGMGVVTQPRGDGTQINGSEIPYSSSESINEVVDRKEDTSSVDSKLALKANLNGSISEVFKSLQGTSNEDVVVLSKLLAELLLKSDVTYVDDKLALKANEDNVLLKDGTSPDFTPVSPNQPSTKKYVDDLIIDVGAGDMLKSIYDLGDTGAVDTSEAIGRFGTLLGQTPMNQVMRLSQSNVVDCNILDDFGIYVGTSVDNAPGSGVILLEQFTISTSKLQRCFVAGTNRWYDRTFNGTIWSGWNEWDLTDWVDVQDVPENVSNALSRSGGEMTGQVKGIAPVANEDLTRKDYVDSRVQQVTQAEYDALTPDPAVLYCVIG